MKVGEGNAQLSAKKLSFKSLTVEASALPEGNGTLVLVFIEGKDMPNCPSMNRLCRRISRGEGYITTSLRKVREFRENRILLVEARTNEPDWAAAEQLVYTAISQVNLYAVQQGRPGSKRVKNSGPRLHNKRVRAAGRKETALAR
jgi:hypothetical protein